MEKKFNYDVVIIGGGAKCAAYLGVIKAFEEEGIEINMIIGSSGGAVAGGSYAILKDVDLVTEHFKKYSFDKYFLGSDLLKELRIVSDDKAIDWARLLVGRTQIEDSQIPLFIQATNLRTGQNTIFKTGEAALCAVASSAIPWLVKPIEVEGEKYIDGDFTSGFANRFLKSEGAEVVIGMCPDKALTSLEKGTTIEKIVRPMDIMTTQIRRLDQDVDPVDFLVEDLAKDYSFYDFPKAEEISDHGYEVAKAKMEEIMKLLY